MMKKIYLVLAALLALGICNGQTLCTGNPFGANVSYSCATVSYGSHSKQKYDIYVPFGTSSKQVVIFIHGGSFVKGKKENIKNNYYKDVVS